MMRELKSYFRTILKLNSKNKLSNKKSNNYPRLFSSRKTLFFVCLLFCANTIFGQSFFQSYPNGDPNFITEITATAGGFELETGEGLSASFPEFSDDIINVNNSGNIVNTTTYSALPALGLFDDYYRLVDGNYLRIPGQPQLASALQYQVLDGNGNTLNTFNVNVPAGASGGSGGVVTQYPNGDLLVTVQTEDNQPNDIIISRVNPYSGQIFWQSNYDISWGVGTGVAKTTTMNDNQEVFIQINNAEADLYYMMKVGPNGNIPWVTLTGQYSRYPIDLEPASNGGVWFIDNQGQKIIRRFDQNGDFQPLLFADQIMSAGVSSVDQIIKLNTGGVMGTGLIGQNIYFFELDANGNTVRTKIIDNLPTTEIKEVSSGIILSSGEIVLGGMIDPTNSGSAFDNHPFLLKLNSDGEYVEGGGGCNVSITSSNGGVTITGLTGDANAKLFDANTQAVWSCNPWQGNPCSGNETVSGLTSGATYFLSVQSAACNEWIPVTIQGGGVGGPTCSDGIQNQGEEYIDCGGPCEPCVNFPCNIGVTSSNGAVNIIGLSSTVNAKLFDSNTQAVWSCNPWQGNPCSANETVANLTVGATYYLSAQSTNCDEWIGVVVQGGGGGCPDADGDGVCNNDDCQPNNPSLPTTPGTACNDVNSSTTNDVIQADGCTCAGTPITSCNVNISSSNGGVLITGLTSDANTKLFDANTQAVWGCNPWQGNPCFGSIGVSDLTVGATYFLSVQSSVCNEWIPITIVGGDGGGGNEPDLTVSNLTIGSGAPGEVLGFTFDLANQGSATVGGVYFIRTYISPDPILGNGNDIQEGSITTGNTPVGSTSVNGAITVPNLPAGSYYLILVVDDGNIVLESNENNNTDIDVFTITGGGGGCITSNVALGRPTSQSSTITAGGVTGTASKAVDGNTNGNFFSGSVAATNNTSEAWWEVDLGTNYDVSSIEVFNRTEGSARLDNFYILASDTPFNTGSLATARNIADAENYINGQAGTPTTWNYSGAPFRYLRIQRNSPGHVTLAEVRVNGCSVNLIPNNEQGFVAFEDNVENTFSINELFPNPTRGEVITRIDSNFEGVLTIQIVNMFGRVVKTDLVNIENGINSYSLELDTFGSGIYQIIFSDENETISRRVVKIK